MSCHALCPGSLQIWYHLQTDRSPDVFSPALGNLADGRLHRIRIHRVGKNLYVQVSSTWVWTEVKEIIFWNSVAIPHNIMTSVRVGVGLRRTEAAILTMAFGCSRRLMTISTVTASTSTAKQSGCRWVPSHWPINAACEVSCDCFPNLALFLDGNVLSPNCNFSNAK